MHYIEVVLSQTRITSMHSWTNFSNIKLLNHYLYSIIIILVNCRLYKYVIYSDVKKFL